MAESAAKFIRIFIPSFLLCPKDVQSRKVIENFVNKSD